ncbi:MAG: DUF4861 family protein [Candidatus Hydrogenedentes bacterium]|nr:DUF4861 family protein [Candidatus Hydrogenedentota bacterium]
MTIRLLASIGLIALVAAPGAAGQAPGTAPTDTPNHIALVRILGPHAEISPELREKVLAAPPGQRFYDDLDGDGDPDAVTYVDTDPKHTIAPILVRALDDDDDLVDGGGPDSDSDCYIADWHGDGAIDRVVDYWDEDGDSDPDRMDIYYRNGAWFRERFGLIVIRDVGDDDRMWYTENYEYQQPTCQWKTDFNGDEIFSMFFYDFKRNTFIPFFENPFAHYDTDGDGLAEVTVRANGGIGADMDTLRYSFDVDNDSNWLNRRDYDFSFNCTGPVSVAADAAQAESLRDGTVCAPYVAWDRLRPVMEAAPWKSNRLCWDEIDNNVDVNSGRDRWHERWEGVGGYPMREGNKRWEADGDYSGRMALYYSPVDRRIHLFGAESGETRVDYDFDGTTDAILSTRDTDGDGYFDTWAYDADGDGTPERSYKAEPRARPVARQYPDLTEVYAPALESALVENQALIDTLKGVLGDGAVSAVEEWYAVRRPGAFYNPDKILWSREAARYYQDLIREELYTLLLARVASGALELDLQPVEKAYAEGRYARAAEQIARQCRKAVPESEPWLDTAPGGLTKRVRLRLVNPIAQDRPSAPVAVPIEQIRAVAPDFNPDAFAVADTRRAVVIREYPSQADDLDGDGTPDEIVFRTALDAGGSRDCFLYYAPSGRIERAYRPETHARDGINVVGIGWESELAGFRSYYGKFDLYAKKIEGLRLDDLGSYHEDADWGMDVLHVGSAPGIGGVSLWHDGQVYRAYNEENVARCAIEQQIAADGPVRAAVRIDLRGIECGDARYDVSVLASAYAGQLYSEHRIHVRRSDGAPLDGVALSAGLVRIEQAALEFDAAAGALCLWGDQGDPAVGEIGLAIMAPPGHVTQHTATEDSEELLIRIPEDGRITVFAVGEWEKSQGDQRRLVAHSAPEWAKHVHRLAARALNPVRVEVCAPVEE